MSVLESAFAGVRILLCQFHVIKYLSEEIAKGDEYGFNPWQKDQLRGIIPLLVNAKSEREYNKHRRYVHRIITVGSARRDRSSVGQPTDSVGQPTDSDGNPTTTAGCGSNLVVREDEEELDQLEETLHPFESYFKRNWENCKEKWCSYERQNAVTLGNDTNNRLEASWKQIKDIVNSFMQLDECIASLMYYQSIAEKQFVNQLFKIKIVHHAFYDKEMQNMANTVSEHACSLIYEQYVYAVGRATYSFYEGIPGVMFIKSLEHDEDALDSLDEPNQEYNVDMENWRCSCMFMSTRLLPCRHVLYLRKELKKETIIPPQLHPRWLLTTLRASFTIPEVPDKPFRIRQIVRSEPTDWDANRKFREAKQVANTISNTMSSLGMREYREALRTLTSVAELFKHRQFHELDRLIADTQSVQTQLQDNESSTTPDQPPTEPDEFPTEPDEFPFEPNEVPVEVERPLELGEGSTVSDDPLIATDEPVTSPVLGSNELPIDTAERPSEGDVRPIKPDDDFEIASPVRPRGRPKQKASAKKAKKNREISDIHHDSNMFHMNLNLSVLTTLLREDHTFNSSEKTLREYRLFVFEKKQSKQPIAHRKSKLPTKKTVLRDEEVSRILPKDMLRKCSKKLSALQSKHKDQGLREEDILLEVPTIGVFTTKTLTTMRNYHRAMDAIAQIDKAIVWTKTISFDTEIDPWYLVEEDERLLDGLKDTRLQSTGISSGVEILVTHH
ncbi:hypothetical protein F443_23087 [Phytophthora nicotianae P1569]|uniref:SWIM-type domain-containing protein n=1 Tax=Phytophthora nicotianae P1569 TaxID=1317065 RepID=V9DUU6_PHYNI|nr:hypothetical protein F443_23087 [Phytophthora nicotianae P1569]